MADLTIPKGQTYPFIRGYAADEDGGMDEKLEAAHALSLVLDDGAGGNPTELEVEYVASGETFTLNGQEIPVNWQTDYSGSGLSASQMSWRGKLKIQHDEGGEYVTFVPRDGFVEITITANVTEAS